MKPLVPLVILVRLFAFYWATSGVVVAVAFLGSAIDSISGDSISARNFTNGILVLALPIFYLTIGFLAWVFAAPVSRFLMAGVDPDFRLPEVSPASLFTLGLLLLGGFFFLSHLAPALGQLYLLARTREAEKQLGDDFSTPAYQAMIHVVPCLLGLALAMMSAKFGAKLAKLPYRASSPLD